MNFDYGLNLCYLMLNDILWMEEILHQAGYLLITMEHNETL